MSLVIHAVVLYGSALAAIVATLATRRRPGDPALSPGRIAATMAPFMVIGLLEELAPRAGGHMTVEWALPLLAALVVAAYSRDARVVRVAGLLLVLVSLAAWVHGMALLTRGGYVIGPHPAIAGMRDEVGWYTPVLGYRKVIR
jgi:hypothetical protein